jgi:glycosyltransferase involved in cell wall biosynthesis
MRIAYLLTSLGIGGAERQVISLAERMAARGHSVKLVVLLPLQNEEWPTDLSVVHLDMRKSPLGVIPALLCGRSVLRDFQPDVVHSHTFPANMAARALRLLGPTTTVLSTIHNVYEGGPLRTIAYRLSDHLCLYTTAVSEAVARRSIDSGAVLQRKCSVVTNGIDTEEFAPDPDRRAEFRAQMLANDDFIWLAAGRIVPAKDYPNLLRAFAHTISACPQTQLWIAGEATYPARNQLQALIHKHGLTDRVELLGLRRDMPALLDAADAFVLASAWEGMPLALGEAMAMEKPVVSTEVGGVCEFVGGAGTLVPAKDSSALAAAMLSVMRQPPDARQAQGRAARERIEKNFSMDSKADEWETLYSSILPGVR